MKIFNSARWKPGLLSLPLWVLALIMTGCMGAPQNNQEVAAQGPIAFEGAVPEVQSGVPPQAEVEIQYVTPYTSDSIIRNMRVSGGGTTPLAIFPVATANPRADGSGKNWYAWGGSVFIPDIFWRAVEGQNKVETRIMAKLKNSSTYLATFDFGATSSPECVAAKESEIVTNIISYCKSSQSPIVTINSRCGNYKEVCCKGNNRCVAHYECAEFDFVPNPSGEGDAYFGDISSYRPYSNSSVAPAGRQKGSRCLARIQDYQQGDTFF